MNLLSNHSVHNRGKSSLALVAILLASVACFLFVRKQTATMNSPLLGTWAFRDVYENELVITFRSDGTCNYKMNAALLEGQMNDGKQPKIATDQVLKWRSEQDPESIANAKKGLLFIENMPNAPQKWEVEADAVHMILRDRGRSGLYSQGAVFDRK